MDIVRSEISGRNVDCDLHITLPSTRMLLPYLDDHWKEQVSTRGIDGLDLSFSRPNSPGSIRPDWRREAVNPGSDIDRTRSEALDPFNTRFAIANCLYGAQALPNPDQGAALCRAMNDWLVAEWLDRDDRFRASIVVPWQVPELAADEINYRAADRRFVQVLILVSGDMPLGKRMMWPIYAAAEKFNLPVGIHAGTNYRYAPTGGGWPSYQIEDTAAFAHAFQQQLLSLVVEGVFSRFPRLKVVLLESGISWLPAFLSRVDKVWKGLRVETPWVDRRPSEIIRDRVRLTLQPFDVPNDVVTIKRIIEHLNGDHMLLFSTDYPHWHFDHGDGFPPGFDLALKKRMLVDNPLETYPRLSERIQ